MRISISQLYKANANRTAATQSALPAERKRMPAHAAGVATVWQSTLTSFVLRAPAILSIACICIAGPAIICLLIYAALGLDTFVHMGGPLATWEAIITLRNNGSSIVIIVLVVQVGLGATGLAFARGVIARLALNVSDSDGPESPDFVVACHEAMTRFPSLLIVSLIYGAFVTAGAVGINAALRDTIFDLRHVGRRDIAAQTLALRALDALVPSPGSPLAEFVPLLRHSSFADTTRFDSTTTARSDIPNRYRSYISYQVQGPSVNASTHTDESNTPFFAISLTSLGVLLLAEALLGFTPVMVMNTWRRTKLDAITPVLHSIGFGIRHFGAITMHVWLLRLTFVAGYSVFFMLPMVLSKDVAPPILTSVTRSVMGYWSVMLTLVCHWLVIALFVAFSTVYDTRLAMCLDSYRRGQSSI